MSTHSDKKETLVLLPGTIIGLNLHIIERKQCFRKWHFNVWSKVRLGSCSWRLLRWLSGKCVPYLDAPVHENISCSKLSHPFIEMTGVDQHLLLIITIRIKWMGTKFHRKMFQLRKYFKQFPFNEIKTLLHE